MEPQINIKCNKDGVIHEHDTIDQLMTCVGSRTLDLYAVVGPAVPKATPSAPVRPVVGVTVPSGTPVTVNGRTGEVQVVHKEAKPTVAQLKTIEGRGGSWRDAFLGNRAEASTIIGALANLDTKDGWLLPEKDVPLDDDEWEMFPQERAWRRGELGREWQSFHDGGEQNAARLWQPDKEPPAFPGTGSSYRPVPVNDEPSPIPSEDDPSPAMLPIPKAMAPDKDRMDIIVPLLTNVKEGYYATETGDGRYNDLRFFRISRPKKGNYAGNVKIQWQLADSWELAMLVRPNGTFWEPRSLPFSMVDYLLNIVVDASGCARRYAKEIDKCCRCNTTLTDERSRHYGIGPECEKYWPHIINLVDQEDELRREEENNKWAGR